MELSEVISDALVYPFQNIKAFIIYMILGIILGIVAGGTLLGMLSSAAVKNGFGFAFSGIVGMIIAVIIGFFINGYQLDIIKLGIQRSYSSPEIDFVRQFVNGIKLFVVSIVFMIVPILVSAILGAVFQGWITSLITIIISFIFSLALMMGQCRLAKTEDLGYALAIGDAIGDISKIGVLKLLALIIVEFIIIFVLFFIVAAIMSWNSTIGGILLGILGVYIAFFTARATGLIYSGI